MGHAVEIVTSCADVFSTADSIWQPYPRLSNSPAVQLTVDASSVEPALVPPVTCHVDHLFAVTQDAGNFGTADMQSGVGNIKISRYAVRNSSWFAYSFLEPLAYVLLGAKHFTMLHAACVERDGRAVLLCGPSGAGKTCLAYACARRGWSFVSGDATQLVRREREPTIIGRPFSIRFRYSAKMIFPEFRHFPAVMRPNGKCDLQLDPRDLGLPISLKARAAAIVFLNRDANARRAAVQHVSRPNAKRMLMEPVALGNAEMLAEQEAALDRLLEKTCVRLTYSDPFDAEPVLRSLLERSE
jgi:hypothetical protein